jgi:hypothetical protein
VVIAQRPLEKRRKSLLLNVHVVSADVAMEQLLVGDGAGVVLARQLRTQGQLSSRLVEIEMQVSLGPTWYVASAATAGRQFRGVVCMFGNPTKRLY